MMDYRGEVTLPDGRVVHGVVKMSGVERDTGADNFIKCDLEWQDGTPLTPDEHNTLIAPEGMHVWEYVVEKIIETTEAEYPDDGEGSLYW